MIQNWSCYWRYTGVLIRWPKNRSHRFGLIIDFSEILKIRWLEICHVFRIFFSRKLVLLSLLFLTNVEMSIPEIKHSSLWWEVTQQTRAMRLRSQHLWLLCYFGVLGEVTSSDNIHYLGPPLPVGPQKVTWIVYQKEKAYNTIRSRNRGGRKFGDYTKQLVM